MFSFVCSKRRYTNRQRMFLTFLLVAFIYFYLLNFMPGPMRQSARVAINLKGSKEFSPVLSVDRLNRLFNILHSKEFSLGELLDRLDILKFQDLLNGNIKLEELTSKLLVIEMITQTKLCFKEKNIAVIFR